VAVFNYFGNEVLFISQLVVLNLQSLLALTQHCDKKLIRSLVLLFRRVDTLRYIHPTSSGHGYLSPQVPALSSIVLGQLNNPAGIDGYVTAGKWPCYEKH